MKMLKSTSSSSKLLLVVVLGIHVALAVSPLKENLKLPVMTNEVSS